eukprot:990344-Lingulodinium_polyedra.AAC.1
MAIGLPQLEEAGGIGPHEGDDLQHRGHQRMADHRVPDVVGLVADHGQGRQHHLVKTGAHLTAPEERQ